MSNNSIERVRYFKQQFLRTQDFSDEQTYHVAMRRRHNIAQHNWGIVHGLDIRIEEDGLFLQPGYAVDGYGRELILAGRLPISDKEFVARNTEEIDVWLVYNRTVSGKPVQAQICNNEEFIDYYRWRENPVLRIEKHIIGLNPRKPPSVPEEDYDFPPYRTSPDDPVQDWPVFLGSIKIDRTDPAKPAFIVDRSGRPGAGLVGDKIQTPSNRASLTLDTVYNGEDNPDIGLERSNVFKVLLKNADEQWIEHLSINDQGQISLNGNTNIRGDLSINRGSIKFANAENSVTPEQIIAAASKTPANPWKVYRYDKAETSDTETSIIQQLRIEMAPLPADTQDLSYKSQVVIGAWSPDAEDFQPILTVGNVNHPEGKHAVTVHGDLIVKGSIKKVEAGKSRGFSPQASNFLVGSYQAGLAGANLQLPGNYLSPFARTPCDITDPDVRRSIVENLVKDTTEEQHLSSFVQLLLDEPKARTEIIKRLVADPTWLEEIATELVKATGGPQAIVNAVENAGGDVLTDFVDRLLADTDRRAAVSDNLVAKPERISDVIQPIVTNDDITPRDECLGIVVSANVTVDAGVRNSVGEYLARNIGNIGNVVLPILEESTAVNKLATVVFVDDSSHYMLNDAQVMPVVVQAVVDHPDARALAEDLLSNNVAWVEEFMDKALQLSPIPTDEEKAIVEKITDLVINNNYAINYTVQEPSLRTIVVNDFVEENAAREQIVEKLLDIELGDPTPAPVGVQDILTKLDEQKPQDPDQAGPRFNRFKGELDGNYADLKGELCAP